MTPFFITKISGTHGTLEGEEARHCIKVMRNKAGDRIIGVDGKGFKYVGKISGLGRNLVELDLMDKEENWGENPRRIQLLVSPLHKVDRFEWLVEKAVELGVTDIHPYLSKHTVKTGIRADRLERIMIAALKQCLRSRLPKLHELVHFEDALDELAGELRFVAHVSGTATIADYQREVASAESIGIVIGPEGDFAESELEVLDAAGFRKLGLGQNRLRSETAAIHLMGLVKHYAAY